MKHSNLKQFLVNWNQTPLFASIQVLFEFQVKKSPNAVAVTYLDQQLTYIQLNKKANQLVYHLQSLGVKRGPLVSIYLERSIKMVICMLAIRGTLHERK